MSMMQAAPAAAQSPSRQHVAPQQQQQQQQQQVQQQQQQQFQRSQSSSHQFSCLYTHQKTQKRKKWQDGRFTVEFGRVGKLFDANPTPGSGNPCLAQVELSRPEATALIERHQTNIEAEKYLIQLEGLWVDNHSYSSSAQQPTAAEPSSKMQKLMKSKYRRPGKAGTFRPPNPQSHQVATTTARRRPLQPGELVRQHYGGGDSGFGAGPPHNHGYNNNNNDNISNAQNQHPNQDSSSLPAWKTPPSIVPVNPQAQPNGPRSTYNQQRQKQQPHFQYDQQHRSFVGQNAIGMQNGNNQNNSNNGAGSNWSRSSQPQSFSSNNNNPYQMEGQAKSHDQSGNGNVGQHARQQQQHAQSGLFPTPQQGAPGPRPTTGQTQPSNTNSSHETPNHFPAGTGQGPLSNGPAPGFPVQQQPPRSRQEFVQNGFDPSHFYGEDGDDEDSDDDDDDGGGGFALSSHGWFPSAAAVHPKQNDTMDPNNIGNNDAAKHLPGNSGSMELHQGPAATTSHDKTSTSIAQNGQQATMTNQDLLALFGGGDDDSQSQSQADDEVEDGHDQDHANIRTGHQHLPGNQETTNSNNISHPDTSLFKQPTLDTSAIALGAGVDTGIDTTANGAEHEFSLPPVESSSDSSDSDGD